MLDARMVSDVTTKARQAMADAHRQLFRLLYHLPSTISTQEIQKAQTPIEKLYTIADMYGCTVLVAAHMRNFVELFRHTFHRYHALVDNLPSLLSFSMRTRSPWMFREVMRNLIGCPERLNPATREACYRLGLKPLLLAKEADFRLLLQSVEHLLFINFGYGATSQLRDPSAAAWVRESFRCWFVEEIRKGLGSGLGPGYAKVYRHLQFVKIPGPILTAINARSLSKVQNLGDPDFLRAMEEAFREAAPIIAPLMRTGDSVSWPSKANDPMAAPLTCITITYDELPWKDKPW